MSSRMIRSGSIPVVMAVLLVASYCFPAGREKAEEGRYAILRDGKLVQGTEHSWILWRLPDGGYELEDHFQPSKEMLSLTGTLLSKGMPISPDFRESLENGVQPSDLTAVYAPDRRLRLLTVTGKKVNGNTGEGLKCKAGSSSIECAGTGEKAKMHLDEPRGLFWLYGNPLLLRAWLPSAQSGLPSAATQKATLLLFGYGAKMGKEPKIGMKYEPGRMIFWGDRPKLEPAEVSVINLGADKLVLGTQSFNTQKYKLELKAARGDPLSLTAWTDAQGVILALADDGNPGALLALVQYKRYSDPGSSTPPPSSPPATDK